MRQNRIKGTGGENIKKVLHRFKTMKFLILLFNVLFFFGCDQSKTNDRNVPQNQRNYKNVTSSREDIDFYELVEVNFNDGNFNGSIWIPKFLSQGTPIEENEILYYQNFDKKSGYTISIGKLSSRNTQKLSDKEYLDIMNDQFLKKMNGDLTEIEKILPPVMKHVRVVQFDSNLTIHDKYFGKRILYCEDDRFSGTDLEGVTILNFQFITLQNKTKYTFDINYFGDDKSLSQLVGLFDTIGGSIKFD